MRIKLLKTNNFKTYNYNAVDGYKFTPKSKFIKNLIVIDDDMINIILKKKIKKDLNRAVIAIKLMLKSDVTEVSDCDMMINELNRIAIKLEDKYRLFFEKNEYFEIVKDIYYWNMQIKTKKTLIENS